MIEGIGCDIVKISRLTNKQDDLAKRILTDHEYSEYIALQKSRKLAFLAGRFAAKEAIFKAINDDSVCISSIEIRNETNGKPFCHMPNKTVHISISHEDEFAIAYAMCESRGEKE